MAFPATCFGEERWGCSQVSWERVSHLPLLSSCSMENRPLLLHSRDLLGRAARSPHCSSYLHLTFWVPSSSTPWTLRWLKEWNSLTPIHSSTSQYVCWQQFGSNQGVTQVHPWIKALVKCQMWNVIGRRRLHHSFRQALLPLHSGCCRGIGRRIQPLQNSWVSLGQRSLPWKNWRNLCCLNWKQRLTSLNLVVYPWRPELWSRMAS